MSQQKPVQTGKYRTQGESSVDDNPNLFPLNFEREASEVHINVEGMEALNCFLKSYVELQDSYDIT